MINIIKNWYLRHFSNPQAVVLLISLVLVLCSVVYLGDILAPVFAAIIIAYLLESVVKSLETLKMPRLLAVCLVMFITVSFAVLLIIGMVPPLVTQTTEIVTQQVPNMVVQTKDYLDQLPAAYPNVVTPEQVQTLTKGIEGQISTIGKDVLGFSRSLLANVFTFGLYSVIVPIMVFFMLKDKKQILAWSGQFFSKDTLLSKTVWEDVDSKIGNYVRGKFIEIGLVWIASFVVFRLMGLNYALLLSFLVGLSVIIPFVGAVSVTLPVVAIAFLQWGWSAQFAYLFIAYMVIQIIDGNVLVPILFSEVVSLHPVAIIVALVFFGGIWGIWGVFFAIPLATLVQAVLKAWPSKRLNDEQEPQVMA